MPKQIQMYLNQWFLLKRKKSNLFVCKSNQCFFSQTIRRRSQFLSIFLIIEKRQGRVRENMAKTVNLYTYTWMWIRRGESEGNLFEGSTMAGKKRIRECPSSFWRPCSGVCINAPKTRVLRLLDSGLGITKCLTDKSWCTSNNIYIEMSTPSNGVGFISCGSHLRGVWIPPYTYFMYIKHN